MRKHVLASLLGTLFLRIHVATKANSLFFKNFVFAFFCYTFCLSLTRALLLRLLTMILSVQDAICLMHPADFCEYQHMLIVQHLITTTLCWMLFLVLNTLGFDNNLKQSEHITLLWTYLCLFLRSIFNLRKLSTSSILNVIYHSIFHSMIKYGLSCCCKYNL